MRAIVRLVQQAAERRMRVPADYIGRIGETSFSGFLKFLLFMPLAGHRKSCPAVLLHVARIVTAQHEDCGACVQTTVNLALDNGVDADTIRAVLARKQQDLSADIVLIIKFVESVLANDGTDNDLRVQVERTLGAKALTELALALASARVFPTLKRALGFAQSCSLIQVDIKQP
jgi:alkylhydroperoxidase family enzyme